MLILVTGVPGSGKSLYSVKLINDYLKENKKNKELRDKGIFEQNGKPVPEPRNIYSDIDGLNIEGVQHSPDDWRDCPDGSVVIYDECQQKFGPDGAGRSNRKDIQEFETHRHRGFDIILITQHPKLLHSHIRRLIGRHYHIFRMYGTQNVKVFMRDGQIDVDKPSALTQCDEFMWTYPKELFGQYKSATVHTHKAYMPKWLFRALIALVVLAAFVIYMFSNTMSFLKGDIQAETQSQNLSLDDKSSQNQTVSNEIVITPANDDSPVACITMGDKCSCYNAYGYLLDIPFHYCKKFTEDTPRYIDLQSRQARRAAAT